MSPHQHGRPMLIGAGLALSAWPLWLILGSDRHTVVAGVLLAAIGGVYFGFAVADGRPAAIAVQSASVVVFVVIAYLGVHHDEDWILGVGFLGHAAWDWLHHSGGGPTRVRTWYPPFCAVADLLLAVPLLAGWAG